MAWFAVFVSAYATELHDLWRHNLRLSLAVGAVAGAGLVAMVLSQAGTDHPDGWRFGFEILWRGLVYGSVDALTLFVFPAAVAYLLMHGNRKGAKRKAGFAGLALLLSLLVSTSYHLGYPEYRDADLRSPLIGTIVANVPTALTGNPLGAVVAHPMVHVAAVVHQRNGGSTQMLPPKVGTDYPSHGRQRRRRRPGRPVAARHRQRTDPRGATSGSRLRRGAMTRAARTSALGRGSSPWVGVPFRTRILP